MPGLALHLVVLVGRDHALAVVERFEPGEIDRLADGRDDQVGGDVFFGAGDLLHVEFAADDPGLAAGHDAQRRWRGRRHRRMHGHRRQPAADGDAFGQRVLDLVLAGLHLVDREDRGQRDLGAHARRQRGGVVRGEAADHVLGPVALVHLVDVAEAPGHGGDVDRGVAAADHDHALADMLHAAVVEGLQEGRGGDDVGRLGAVDRQRAAALRAQAQEHGVEAGLDVVERDVGADAAVHAQRHAEVDDAPDLGVEHVARRAKARDAVAHHAAGLLALVEDRHRVALAAPAGRRADRPAGPAPMTATVLPVCCAGLRKCQLVLDGPFAEEMLDRVDADEILDLVAVAARFAGRRADAAHHRGQRIGLGQAAPGVLLPRHAGRRLLDAAHDVEVAADVLARGACALARRRALDVGRALVRVIGVEDFLLPGQRLGVTVFEAAKGQRLGCAGVRGHGHRETPRWFSDGRGSPVSRRSMPSALSTYFSNAGSELPVFILRMKYFSKAILARCTHLPFLNQFTLRGGICGSATKAAPVSPMSARQMAFQVALAVAVRPLKLVGDVVHDRRDHGLDHVAGLRGAGGHRRDLHRWDRHADAGREDVLVGLAALELVDQHEAARVAQLGHRRHGVHALEGRQHHGQLERHLVLLEHLALRRRVGW